MLALVATTALVGLFIGFGTIPRAWGWSGSAANLFAMMIVMVVEFVVLLLAERRAGHRIGEFATIGTFRPPEGARGMRRLLALIGHYTICMRRAALLSLQGLFVGAVLFDYAGTLNEGTVRSGVESLGLSAIIAAAASFVRSTAEFSDRWSRGSRIFGEIATLWNINIEVDEELLREGLWIAATLRTPPGRLLYSSDSGLISGRLIPFVVASYRKDPEVVKNSQLFRYLFSLWGISVENAPRPNIDHLSKYWSDQELARQAILDLDGPFEDRVAALDAALAEDNRNRRERLIGLISRAPSR